MTIFNKTTDNQPVENEEQSVQSTEPQTEQQPFNDLLSVVVNDKGEQKYSSVPEAIKGLAHSQEYIKTLEAELASTKGQLENTESIKDALQNLSTQQADEKVETPTQGLSSDEVNALLEKQLEVREQRKTVENNTQQVVSAIQNKFGDKAEEVFYKKASELGMTQEQFNNLAAQSPNAVLSFFDVKATPSVSVTQGSINTASLTPQVEEVPTFMENGQERIRLKAPERSVLMGASTQDLQAEAERHRKAVFQKYGIKF